jgi:hypothetical protein
VLEIAAERVAIRDAEAGEHEAYALRAPPAQTLRRMVWHIAKLIYGVEYPPARFLADP